MTKPIIRIHDVTTNELIDREMTDVEFEAYQAQQVIDAAEVQAQADALAAKEATQAKLLALGLTEDDLISMGLIAPKVQHLIPILNEA